MSDLINQVGGIGKAREVVEGAPEGFLIYFLGLSNGYIRCCPKDKNHISLDELRKEIADHDRTDNCVNIENHLSPSTKIINK